MKKILSLLALLQFAALVSAQNIPNSGFENWVQYSAVGERPTEWSTLDSITMTLSSFQTHCAVKTTDAAVGTYAIKMTTSSVFIALLGSTVIVPGAATNGRITASLTSYTFDGGSPTTVRSKFFNGKYKYTPANVNDGAVFIVALLRRNPITGSRDTIAYGADTISGAVSTYTPFSVVLKYNDYVNNPDSCLLLLQSSKALNDVTLGAGSELFVDDLSFNGTVGLDEVRAGVKEFSVYPSPASSVLNVRIDLTDRAKKWNVQIMDINGKELIRRSMESWNESFAIHELSEGNYLINLLDENNQPVSSRKFSVVR